MERNVLIDNDKVVFTANHFVDEKFNPITSKDLNKNRELRSINIAVVFCPKCNKMHPIFRTYSRNGDFLFDKKEYPLSFYTEWKGPASGRYNPKFDDCDLICPNCGEILSNYTFRFLEKEDIHPSRTIKSMKIFEPKDDKLIASIFLTYYFPNTKAGKLAVLPIRHRLVFNYKTGKTYFLEGRDLSNKHPKWDVTPKILNASLGNNVYGYSALQAIVSNKQIIAELATSLIEVHHGKKEQLTLKGDFSDTTFTMLAIYNNVPFFNYHFYFSADEISRHLSWDRNERDRFTYRLRTLKKKYLLNDPQLFQKYLMKGVKLSLKKAIKKELFANPLLLDAYKFAKELGFSNNVVLFSWISTGFPSLSSFRESFERADTDFKPLIIDYVRKLIEIKGEAGTYKCLVCEKKENGKTITDMKAASKFLRDTALMYVMFKERGMLRPEYFKGDIKKIHDLLSRDYKKIREVNKVLEYSDEIYQLEEKVDDFTFKLAIDTYELIDIGQELHICVGSYGSRAASKSLIIVKMMKGNNYVGCIELSSDGKRLVQAKACFNNLLEEKKAEALKKWVENHNIDASRCSDYRHIQKNDIRYDENEIYRGNHDYANYGIYVDGDVRRLLRNQEMPQEEDRGFMHIPDEDDDDWGDLPFI